MGISLRDINKYNYEACVNLRVKDQQKNFVAENAYSLVQSFYEENIYTLAIYYDETMVGFILYDFDLDLNGWSFSRFMIDHKYQGRGYGKRALAAFLGYFKNLHPHTDLFTSAELENETAISLYKSFGFNTLEPFEYTYNGHTYRELRMVKSTW